MTRKDVRVNKTVQALAKKEIAEHLGRWCEVTLKRTGETVKVVRTGYGPMERPEWDKHEIKIDGEVVESFDNLREVAKWLCER